MSEKGLPQPNAPTPKQKSDRERFYVCPGCGERVDWRDQSEVMRHAKHIRPNGD
jgi:hypothetical protein